MKDEIKIPSSLVNSYYSEQVYQTIKEMERAFHYEESERFLKRITSKPRRKKRK